MRLNGGGILLLAILGGVSLAGLTVLVRDEVPLDWGNAVEASVAGAPFSYLVVVQPLQPDAGAATEAALSYVSEWMLDDAAQLGPFSPWWFAIDSVSWTALAWLLLTAASMLRPARAG